MGQETLEQQPNIQSDGAVSEIDVQVNSFRRDYSDDNSGEGKKTDLDRSSAWGRLRAKFGKDSVSNS